MKAYFSYINARKGPDGKRGVYGRQIVFKYYDDGYNPAELGSAHAEARRGGQGLRGRRLARHRGERGDPAVPEREEGAADPHLHRRVDLRPRRSSTRGRAAGSPRTTRVQDLRPGDRAQQPEREDRRHLPERRLRQGQPRRAQGGARRQGVEHRRRGAVRGDRRRTSASQIAKLRATGATILVIFATPKFAIQSYAIANALEVGPRGDLHDPGLGHGHVPDAREELAAAATLSTRRTRSQYAKDPANPSGTTTPR